MKLLVFLGLLAFAKIISADWEAYKQAIITLDKLGVKADPVFDNVKKGERALSFPCTAISASSSVPTSVHKLRPGDIKVVSAIGDSLTAANGAQASNVFGLLTEYRGVSWSIGGDSDINSVTTLPNMLRKYNSQVKGFSLGTGAYTSNGANFNVAQPGHTSNEMFAQAQELVKRIKANSGVNVNNDWKLITFFVGGNDLCKFCKDDVLYKPQRFIDNIRATLDYFRDNLPRTLVNMVLTLDVSGIETISGGAVCQLLQNYLCDCGITQANADKLNALVADYQRLTKELIASGRYDTTDDFTVVLQTFMEVMKPPLKPDGSADYSYFAPDCFHFSQKGHETAALELWNNMFEPVGQKATAWTSIVGNVNCPTEAKPYIYTNVNSK